MDYAAIAADARAMIAEAGQSGFIRRKATSTNYPASFVITGYKAREIDGARILATDKKALVAAPLDIDPLTSDLLICADGSSLPIIAVEAVKPAGVVVIWKLQVRV